MNPLRDTAVWAVSLLPPDASDYATSLAAFAGIFLAMVAIITPTCLITAAVIRWKERRHA